MPVWIEAGLWGLVAGGALVVGALIAWAMHVPARVVASVMAFGAGVLISALAFDLVDKAERRGASPPPCSASWWARWPTPGQRRARPARRAAPQAVRRAAALRAGAAGQRDRDRGGRPARRHPGVGGARPLPARRPRRRRPGAGGDLHLQPARGPVQRGRHEAQRALGALRLRRLDRRRPGQRAGRGGSGACCSRGRHRS